MVISLNIFFQVREVDTPATCHSSMYVCVHVCALVGVALQYGKVQMVKHIIVST